MQSPTGCRLGLDSPALLKSAQIVPKSDAASEDDGCDSYVDVIDEVSLQEVPHDARAALLALIPTLDGYRRSLTEYAKALPSGPVVN